MGWAVAVEPLASACHTVARRHPPSLPACGHPSIEGAFKKNRKRRRARVVPCQLPACHSAAEMPRACGRAPRFLVWLLTLARRAVCATRPAEDGSPRRASVVSAPRARDTRWRAGAEGGEACGGTAAASRPVTCKEPGCSYAAPLALDAGGGLVGRRRRGRRQYAPPLGCALTPRLLDGSASRRRGLTLVLRCGAWPPRAGALRALKSRPLTSETPDGPGRALLRGRRCTGSGRRGRYVPFLE